MKNMLYAAIIAVALFMPDISLAERSICFTPGTCRLDEFMCASDHEKYVRKASYIIDNHETFRACVVRSTMLDDIQDCLDAFDKRSLLTPE